MELARLVATWSKDPDRQVGAVVVRDNHVLGTGYNGFPRGVVDAPERLRVPATKLALTVHAEVNAVLNAVASVRGATVFCTEHPCHECARVIVQSGIHYVVCPAPRQNSKWVESWSWARIMFEEARVGVSLAPGS
jgi:dCMP deaminase